jgi:hypothetical protein
MKKASRFREAFLTAGSVFCVCRYPPGRIRALSMRTTRTTPIRRLRCIER